ncbi:MAG: glutaminyl-peptide cyclotransferase [Parvularculaceae bacterium]
MVGRLIFAALCVVVGVIMGVVSPARADGGVALYDYRVVASYPHDEDAFTQGLVFHDGQLFESTGNYGESSLRRVDLETGDVLALTPLEDGYFGEGAAIVGDRIVSLTWKSGRGFVHSLDGLERVDEFSYAGEGWGLTTDGEELVMSDGTPSLRFLDPETFEERRRVEVRLGGRPLRDLNELEWVDGEIFANVWRTDYIVVIDPANGEVRRLIDLSGLLPNDERRRMERKTRRRNVLNGVAYDPVGERLFVTGKNWPLLFEIELVARRRPGATDGDDDDDG